MKELMILFCFFKSTNLQIMLKIVLCTHLTKTYITLWPYYMTLLFIKKNFMVNDTDKCFFMLFGVKDEFPSDNASIKISKNEKELGNAFENKPNFCILPALHLQRMRLRKTSLGL